MAGQCGFRPAPVGPCAMRRAGSVRGSSRPRTASRSVGSPRAARRYDAPDLSSARATRFHDSDASSDEPMTVRSARDLARKLVRETAVVAHGVVKGHKSSARPSSGHARDKATTHGTHGRKTFGARAKRHVGCEKQTQKLRDDAEWLRELRRRAAAVAVSIVVAAMSTPDPAQAGFGAPTGAVSSPPLPGAPFHGSTRRDSQNKLDPHKRL